MSGAIAERVLEFVAHLAGCVGLSQESPTARRTVRAFDTTTLTSANADGDDFGCVIQVQSAKHHC